MQSHLTKSNLFAHNLSAPPQDMRKDEATTGSGVWRSGFEVTKITN